MITDLPEAAQFAIAVQATLYAMGVECGGHIVATECEESAHDVHLCIAIGDPARPQCEFQIGNVRREWWEIHGPVAIHAEWRALTKIQREVAWAKWVDQSLIDSLYDHLERCGIQHRVTSARRLLSGELFGREEMGHA